MANSEKNPAPPWDDIDVRSHSSSNKLLIAVLYICLAYINSCCCVQRSTILHQLCLAPIVPPVLVRPDFSTSRYVPDDVATIRPFSSALSVDEMVPFVVFGRVIVVLPMAA